MHKKPSAASRNQRSGDTEFTDFTDSEFSIRAATGTELAQKQMKATKKNSSFVTFVLLFKEIRVILPSVVKNLRETERLLTDCNAK